MPVGSWEPPFADGFDHFTTFERAEGRYAFVQENDGIRLYRFGTASPLPQPEEVYIGPLPERLHVVVLDVEEDFMAVWLVGPGHGAVLFYDISDLRNPCLVGSYLEASGFFDLDGRTAYVERQVSEMRRDLVVISDVTSPAHTVAIEGMAYQRDDARDRVRFITNSEMSVRDGIAYLNIFGGEGRERRHRFASLDLRSPESPVWLDEMDVYGAPMHVIGDRAYIMREDVGVRIIDISDPANMSVIGELTEDTPGRGSSGDPSEPGDLIVDGSRLYALLWGGDWGVYHWRLRVADISDPTSPHELGRLEGDGPAPGMWLQGNELVVADSYGFSLIDVSDPANLRETRRFPRGAAPRAVHLRDSFAYVFMYSGIFTLDLTSPGANYEASFLYPGPIGNVRETAEGFEVGIYGASESIKVKASDPLLPIIDENPADWIPPPHPSIGAHTYLATCGSLWVEGEDGRRVTEIRLDQRDCAEEWQEASYGEHLYVVGGGNLYILDASDPSAPELLALKALAPRLENLRQSAIHVDRQYAYVLHGGLWALDISNPARPKEVAYYPTDARRLDVDGDRIGLVGPGGDFTLLHSKLE